MYAVLLFSSLLVEKSSQEEKKNYENEVVKRSIKDKECECLQTTSEVLFFFRLNDSCIRLLSTFSFKENSDQISNCNMFR